MEPLVYPETRREAVTEDHFGEVIADPYRWLENDVRTDPDVASWVERQNALTRSQLDDLPMRDSFAERIRALFDFERFGLPAKAGGRYFYTRNSGLQNQSQLFVRQGLQGTPRLLLDPNTWAGDGAVALDAWEPSREGRYLLYSIQDGGSDWRVLKVLDVASGETLSDEVRWVKFSALEWVGETGFLYSRFPAPDPGAEFRGLNYDQAVYFHRIGTSQAEDELVFATPRHREYNNSAQLTSDGRWAIITSVVGTDARHEIHVIDLAASGKRRWNARRIVRGFADEWKLVDGLGSRLWFVTNHDAPRYRLVQIDLADHKPRWKTIVPEANAILTRATIVGGQLILNYLEDAASKAEIISLDGNPPREISMTDIGTASGFSGKPGDPETFFSFTSFNRPPTIYRMDLVSGDITPFAEPSLPFDPDDFAIEQRFYLAKDGTRIPLFLVRSKAAAMAKKALPTLLYGYGGFDVSLTPGYSSSRMAWLQAGGAFALANVRGGGEYGRAWHDAGRLTNKQNTFDDFIAAGEYLIAQGITPQDGLAIQGGSNGGMLVGAVVNQRPDLFAAANAQVGVMDMLRFDRFTAGRYWIDDYGDPAKEADFRVLRAYSPYHNIRDGERYPAILVTTADTDDRVVPGHSFKYTAALQHADLGEKPRLIRIETRAGHGAGKPTDKIIAESADVLAFFAHWTKLDDISCSEK
ncbi:prolyl oligopeptidase family serine peptidase [Novosphingobium aquimarinum]|uniref:prolyl oligopeptidase family serine peptidase n=1 Tax=Novosphingobium aquimarinum TaxID=2682494 RepID=UPI0018DB1B3C|nr:prolyl oligopeptidase family serine peptidase [Novosphingobium aquimarinum]